jgi:hypothetical protein
MHAYEIHLYNIYARKMHVYEIYAHAIHLSTMLVPRGMYASPDLEICYPSIVL